MLIFPSCARGLWMARRGETLLIALKYIKTFYTSLGNALGYIRMIRSGSQRFTSDSLRFIPNTGNVPNFEVVCDQIWLKL